MDIGAGQRADLPFLSLELSALANSESATFTMAFSSDDAIDLGIRNTNGGELEAESAEGYRRLLREWFLAQDQ